MTKDRFAAICSSFGVDPSIALEDDEVCDLLASDLMDPLAQNQARLEQILCENF